MRPSSAPDAKPAPKIEAPLVLPNPAAKGSPDAVQVQVAPPAPIVAPKPAPAQPAPTLAVNRAATCDRVFLPAFSAEQDQAFQVVTLNVATRTKQVPDTANVFVEAAPSMKGARAGGSTVDASFCESTAWGASAVVFTAKLESGKGSVVLPKQTGDKPLRLRVVLKDRDPATGIEVSKGMTTSYEGQQVLDVNF